MKTPYTLAAMLVLTALLAACGQSTAEVSKDYPLDVCIVSGEKLGTMGKPHTTQVDGETAYLCCAGCQAKLDKDPATYGAILTNARKAQQASN